MTLTGKRWSIMNIEGCIFDLDGTLADSMWVWVALGKQFVESHHLNVKENFCERMAQLGLEAGAKTFVREFDLDETPEELLGQWLAFITERYAHDVRFKPKAKEFLVGLAGQGVKLAVVTANQPEPLRLVLENNEVADLFQVAISTDDVTETGKSTPEAYWAAARMLGVDVCKCVVFEDVLGPAQQAHLGGFRVVGVYDDSPAQDQAALAAEADRFIHGYDELLGLAAGDLIRVAR